MNDYRNRVTQKGPRQPARGEQRRSTKCYQNCLGVLAIPCSWKLFFINPIQMHVVIIHPEQWNGGSDRCTVALIRHFVSKGYKVTWLTTMIDEYWKDHKFDGVDIREVGLKLHPGDWWSQNVALGWYLVLNNIKPDLVVVDHSAR
ncbi:hypothetical protein ANCDUO_13900 [Ancylostoma duodenale]|uniref:Glycosyltransferase subfamily 4-like N-terminal domain-containing protein n=1 Tax=Ancylostoma duodenale TaxID=51022 RepID=A0A0C2GAK9_9BILA|nr:hypothetical protein ANCDUO_13900 [Ancylostoma duodenale]